MEFGSKSSKVKVNDEAEAKALRHSFVMLAGLAIILLCSSCSGAPGIAPAEAVSPVATGTAMSSTTQPVNLIDVIPDSYQHFFTAEGSALLLNIDEIEKTFSTYGIIDGLYEPHEKTFNSAELSALWAALSGTRLTNAKEPSKAGFHWKLSLRDNVLDKSSSDQIILYMPDHTTLVIGMADQLVTKFYFELDFDIPKDKGEQLDKLFASIYGK